MNQCDPDTANQRPRVAALLTCHNRKALTLAALRALKNSATDDVDLDAFLVDDGSTDGTADAVLSEFPETRILKGNGSLFWNGGMRLAWTTAINAGPFDFYLWLNDDLEIFPETIHNLLAEYRRLAPAIQGRVIIVGKTLSSDGTVSYGALARAPGASRLRFRNPASPGESLVTMNGNCVLIPAGATRDIGISSPSFVHAFGDIDYGLRATRAGYRIHEMGTPVGHQERGPQYSRMKGSGLKALRDFATSPKGMHWREWGAFCLRHGGLLGPINFLAMYINQFRQAARDRRSSPT